MQPILSRRGFLIGFGATVAGATVLPVRSFGGLLQPTLYPPIDLSYFRSPIEPAQSEIRFAYAAISWGGNDLQAIKEISD